MLGFTKLRTDTLPSVRYFSSLSLEGGLADLLLKKGFLSKDQLKIAEIEQTKTGKTFETTLIDLGFMSALTLAQALSEASGHHQFDLKKTLVDPTLLEKFPLALAEKHQVFPLSQENLTLNAAMVDPYDLEAIDLLRRFFTPSHASQDLHIVPFIATPTDLSTALTRYYGYTFSIQSLLEELEASPSQDTTLIESPAIRFIHKIFFGAISQKASDIHFEPEQAFVRIRYRIDGKLQQICVLHKQYWPPLCVRLKILGNMDIAEMRLPQDGHLTYQFSGRKIDFRFSSHPTLFGENIVVRILDKAFGLRNLPDLGFEEEHLTLLKKALSHPQGLILLTGPTGSGKTTSLYAMLDLLNSPQVNIMTLEEPVEYELPLIRQTSLKEGSQFSFAQGIRSILRQDPDILLIGEIRDETTAQMALRAAMTGHLVFSTLHTADVFGVIPRLEDLGLPLRMISSHLLCIVAQRLVRLLCLSCKSKRSLKDEEKRALNLVLNSVYEIFDPVGCEKCHYTGYKGRTVLAEILPMKDEIEDLFHTSVSKSLLKKKARELGFKPLREDGSHKLLQGLISLEEFQAACG